MLLTLCCAATGLSACAHHGSAGAAAASPDVPGANLKNGKAVYAEQCQACHGTDGKGGQIGPRLAGENAKLTYKAVRALVLDPQPPMPKLYPSVMTKADVRDVSAYVETL